MVNHETMEFRDGLSHEVPAYCKKNFRRKECQEFHLNNTCEKPIECPYGFTALRVQGTFWQVFGMIDTSTKMPKERKNSNRSNVTSNTRITKWAETLKFQTQKIEEKSEQQTGDALYVLHDIRISNGQIKTNAEREIRNRNSGIDFGDAFDRAPSTLKSIYKASELLTGQLDMIDFYYNPSQITRGRKYYTHVYKLFDKIRRISQIKADARNIQLNMIGSSTSEAPLYESIAILPQILIDNAIKYSIPGGEVIISVTEDKRLINVSVSSVGPIIEEDEKELIFSRRVRGRYAEQSGVTGSGIGLWVASKVCKYNNVSLELKIEPREGMVNNTPISLNRFILTITK